MNIFRFIADMLHLSAILILLYRIKQMRGVIGKWLIPNQIGLSCKTHEVYLLVFVLRYADLFMYYVSLYNTLMKIFFITSTAFIIYLMRFRRPFNATYDKVADDFPHYYLPLAAAVLTCIVQSGWTPWEMVWSFSLWLEAMAFIP